MDITKLKNNKEYCDGSYFPENEIILTIKEDAELNIHISEKYFSDIFHFAPLTGDDWKGFTRDFHELKGAWEGKCEIDEIDEYLLDLMYYTDKLTMYEETPEVFDLVVDFLTYAKQTGQTVIVEVS